MYCPNCGNNLTPDCNFCSNCGNKIIKDNNEKSNNKKYIIMGFVVGLLLFFGVLFISYHNTHNAYYISINPTTSSSVESSRNSNQTVVEINNTYSNSTVSNVEEAYELIRKDSKSQKDSCPTEILKIEEKMMNDFDITAVNLCEIDINLANELYKAMTKVYELFPKVKGNITNLTIGNMDSRMKGVIAYYQPLFPFAEGDNSIVYKMRVVLNSRFFLNNSLLEESTKNSSLSGHFPPNSTKASPVAHELGHYLSFFAMRKYYKITQSLLFNNSNVKEAYVLIDNFSNGEFSKKMLDEAYELYLSEGNKKIEFDKWREEISKYALSKDESGKYIYDETIAEAFHDVYLNDDKASLPSKYIMRILKKYVEA
jgi:predicted nucleic acid-binding Zn ribbon protein